MKTILYPQRDSWEELCKRPGIDKANLEDTVRDIIKMVRSDKDEAIFQFR